MTVIDLPSALALLALGVCLGAAVPALRSVRRRYAALVAAAPVLDYSVSGEAEPAPNPCAGCDLANLRTAVDYWRAEAGRETARADFYFAMVAGDVRKGAHNAR